MIQRLFDNTTGAIGHVSSDDLAYVEQFLSGASEIQAKIAFLTEFEFCAPMLLDAEHHAGNKYVYHWEYPVVANGIGAYHTSEIPYVEHDEIENTSSGGC